MPEPLIFTIVFILSMMALAFMLFDGDRFVAMVRVGFFFTITSAVVWFIVAFTHLAIKYW